jgi:hypothetical protein
MSKTIPKTTKEETWDEYAERFNALSDKLIEAGIDTKLLVELLECYSRLEV